MSVGTEVRKDGKQVVFLAGPHEGKNGRSMGAVGKHEVKVYVFSLSDYVTVDASDLGVYDG